MSEDLVKRLWASDAASALTNEAARLIEGLQAELRASYLEALAISDTNAELASLLSSSQARLSEAVKVLEKANIALNDWLNIYASDMCEESRVAEAHKRVSEYGTIAYIADVTAEIRAVLATLGEEE